MFRNPSLQMAALAALTVTPASLIAQSNSALKQLEGKKVRLNVAVVETDERSGTLVVQGTVFEVRGDSIHVLREGGQAAHIPLSGVRTVYTYGGKDHLKGGYRGAAIGAGVGLFFTFISPPECDDHGNGFDCNYDGSKPTFVEYAWSNVGIWSFLGGVYGALKGSDRWDPVITQQRLTIAPRKNGVALRWSF